MNAPLSVSVCTRSVSRQASPNNSSLIDSDSPNGPTLTGNVTRSHFALISCLAWPKLSMFQWKIW